MNQFRNLNLVGLVSVMALASSASLMLSLTESGFTRTAWIRAALQSIIAGAAFIQPPKPPAPAST